MNPFDCLLILKKKNTVQHLKETLKASRWIEEASESRFIPYWAVKSAFCPQDDKKKCCFQHLWTFCLIYRVFFKTCTRQKQRQGSWKLDLNTKKKKKSVKPSVMLYVRGYQRDETEYKTDCWKIQFLWTDFPPKNGNTQISTHKTARNWLIVVFLQYRLTRIMLHSGLMGEL